MKTRFCVTKQEQWPDGDYVVEISGGDFNYTNPGQLGKSSEFTMAEEAVEFAIALAQEWQKTSEEEIFIGKGYTGGHTMPFDGEELCEEVFDALRAWAKEEDEKLPQCDRCGDRYAEEDGRKLTDILEDERFCSENCANSAAESYWKEQEQFCECCGKTFYEYDPLMDSEKIPEAVFCSQECLEEEIESRTVECDSCSKVFYSDDPLEDEDGLVFCSQDCLEKHKPDSDQPY